MFFFWACSLVWFATVIAKADFSSVTEMVAGVGIPASVNAFAQAVLLVLWCFFGYETIVGMGSEAVSYTHLSHLRIGRSLTGTLPFPLQRRRQLCKGAGLQILFDLQTEKAGVFPAVKQRDKIKRQKQNIPQRY